MLKFSTHILEASLHRNAQLNPDLWVGEALRPEVRRSLLNFAEAWRKFARIPEDAVLDILMVGGNASYFYNEASDIDVHILINKATLGFGTMTDHYLKDRKSIWSIQHDVRVKGYQVEPYAQDISEKPPQGQGVYSLLRGEWVQKPVVTDYDPAGDEELNRKVTDWQSAIDKLVDDGRGVEEFDALKRKLSEMRKNGIAAGGELSRDNLIFKALRLSGHLDKMSQYVKQKQTRDLSLA